MVSFSMTSSDPSRSRHCSTWNRKRKKQVFISLVNAAPQPYTQIAFWGSFSGTWRLKTGTLDYSLAVYKNHQDISLTNRLIRGSALGPIGGLSARQFNSCLPRTLICDFQLFDLTWNSIWTLSRRVCFIISIRLYDQSEQRMTFFIIIILKCKRPNALTARNVRLYSLLIS